MRERLVESWDFTSWWSLADSQWPWNAKSGWKHSNLGTHCAWIKSWVHGGFIQRENKLRAWKCCTESRNLFWTWNDYWKSSRRSSSQPKKTKAEVRACKINAGDIGHRSNQEHLEAARWMCHFRTMRMHADIWKAEQQRPKSVSKVGEGPAECGIWQSKEEST